MGRGSKERQWCEESEASQQRSICQQDVLARWLGDFGRAQFRVDSGNGCCSNNKFACLLFTLNLSRLSPLNQLNFIELIECWYRIRWRVCEGALMCLKQSGFKRSGSVASKQHQSFINQVILYWCSIKQRYQQQTRFSATSQHILFPRVRWWLNPSFHLWGSRSRRHCLSHQTIHQLSHLQSTKTHHHVDATVFFDGQQLQA